MVLMFKTDKQILVIIEAHHFRQIRTNFIQHPASDFNSICRGNYWGLSMWISTQHVSYWSYIMNTSNTWEKCEYNEAVHRLFLEFKKAHDSIRREALYNILIEFGSPMKLLRLMKMCLNETYNRVRIGKHLSDMFRIKNGLKKEMLYRHCFSTLH